jgi:WXG100 family type VII secretion target
MKESVTAAILSAADDFWGRTRELWTTGGLWTAQAASALQVLAFAGTGTHPDRGGTVKVDIATLQSMAGQCRSEAADTAGRHATLSSSINTSVLDGWTDSQAAVQFSELYEQWRMSAQGVSDALTGMGTLLTSVASSYQQHEADMAARIGAMI